MGLIQRIERLSNLLNADIGKKHWFVQNAAIAKKDILAEITKMLKSLLKYTPTPNGLPDGIKPDDVLFNFFVESGYSDDYIEIADDVNHDVQLEECIVYKCESGSIDFNIFIYGKWGYTDVYEYVDAAVARYILDKLGITDRSTKSSLKSHLNRNQNERQRQPTQRRNDD